MKRYVYQSTRLVSALFISLAPVHSAFAADDALTTSSNEAISLFTQSCITFAGQKVKLLAWIQTQRMTPIPQDLAAKFMQKIPGKAFETSTPVGSYIVASQDDGGCTLLVQHANGKLLADGLEAIARTSKFSLKVTSDHDDANEAGLHHKEYELTGKNRKWRVIISSMPPGKGDLDAIMTAYDMNMSAP